MFEEGQVVSSESPVDGSPVEAPVVSIEAEPKQSSQTQNFAEQPRTDDPETLRVQQEFLDGLHIKLSPEASEQLLEMICEPDKFDNTPTQAMKRLVEENSDLFDEFRARRASRGW